MACSFRSLFCHLHREALADHLHLPPLSFLLILSSPPPHITNNAGWGDFSWCFHCEILNSEIELDAEQALTSICERNPVFFKGQSLLVPLSYLIRELAVWEGLPSWQWQTPTPD